MKIKIFAILSTFIISPLMADDKLHSIGIATGIGGSNDTFRDAAGQELIVDDLSGATEFSYNYKFSEH